MLACNLVSTPSENIVGSGYSIPIATTLEKLIHLNIHIHYVSCKKKQ